MAAQSIRDVLAALRLPLRPVSQGNRGPKLCPSRFWGAALGDNLIMKVKGLLVQLQERA